MSVNKTKVFNIDVSAQPSGVGCVDGILIQDETCSPEVVVYKKVIKLNYNIRKNRENFSLFIKELLSLGVTHVYSDEDASLCPIELYY